MSTGSVTSRHPHFVDVAEEQGGVPSRLIDRCRLKTGRHARRRRCLHAPREEHDEALRSLAREGAHRMIAAGTGGSRAQVRRLVLPIVADV
jgi:hypothetical protein